ncbi:Hypothetical predicted protein [Paramuricea clavata]|uniref:Uncharacterized protein n=1 Tax=Paramuricea clavata TaxID=317549 RepID=A0A7D9EJA1_PARCT|nr:Hypothetical predicted protein [Paramuricea clavata]
MAESRNLASKEAKNLLNLLELNEMDDDDIVDISAEDQAFVATCLLLFLLERKPKTESFLYQFGDAREIALATRPGMAPFLVIGGTCQNSQPHETSVVAENHVVFKHLGLLDAVESMMLLYYVCTLEYPKECFNTFLFLQRQVLKVYDTQKIPTKVLVLMSDIDKM